jgi:hypothetical protein
MSLESNSPLTVPGYVFTLHNRFRYSRRTRHRAGRTVLGGKRIARIRTDVINSDTSFPNLGVCGHGGSSQNPISF